MQPCKAREVLSLDLHSLHTTYILMIKVQLPSKYYWAQAQPMPRRWRDQSPLLQQESTLKVVAHKSHKYPPLTTKTTTLLLILIQKKEFKEICTHKKLYKAKRFLAS